MPESVHKWHASCVVREELIAGLSQPLPLPPIFSVKAQSRTTTEWYTFTINGCHKWKTTGRRQHRRGSRSILVKAGAHGVSEWCVVTTHWGQGASKPIHCLTAINQSNAALADANTASVYSGSPMMWTPFGTRIVFR